MEMWWSQLNWKNCGWRQEFFFPDVDIIEEDITDVKDDAIFQSNSDLDGNETTDGGAAVGDAVAKEGEECSTGGAVPVMDDMKKFYWCCRIVNRRLSNQDYFILKRCWDFK